MAINVRGSGGGLRVRGEGGGLGVAVPAVVLPSPGDYAWLMSGPGPFPNRGSAPGAEGTPGVYASPGSAGLWSRPDLTGVRTVYGSPAQDYACSASDNFSASWESSSFTVEVYLQVDALVPDPSPPPGQVPDPFIVVLNDFGVGNNAVYLFGSDYPVVFCIVGGNPKPTIPVPLETLSVGHPVHIAIVFERGVPELSGDTRLSVYVDGAYVGEQNCGTDVFSSPFNQCQFMTRADGITGWACLTESALSPAELAARAALLHAV